MQHRLVYTLMLLTASTAGAGEVIGPAADSETRILEEIVVEASRAGITALNIPANTSILSRQDVQEFSTRSADEILRQIPGFSLLRGADSIATAPTTATVSLRGLGGSAASRALVLLDGIPIHSPNSSEVYWARIPKHQIERVEVVRGGGANAWGNLSLGGVINIITEKPRRNGLDFVGTVSYPWTTDLSLAGSQVTDRWELSGQASYFDTEGYYNSPDDQLGPIDERVAKEYGSVSGKASYLLSDNARVHLSGSLLDEERNGGTPQDFDTTRIWTVGAGFEIQTAAAGQWRVDLFHEDLDVEDYSTGVNSDRDEEFIRQFRVQPSTASSLGTVWSHRFSGGHTVTAGADYRWTDITVNDFEAYTDGMPGELKITRATQDMGGVFIQDTWELDQRWQLNGSLRYDYVTNQGNVNTRDLAAGASTFSETYARNSETTVNPSLGLRFLATDAVSLRAAAYKGFRAPTLRELYRSSSTRLGIVLVNNPFLAPERLVGAEAGIDWTVSQATLLRVTVFHNVVEDLVQNITRGVAGDEPAYVEPCGWLEAGQTCRELANVGEMESNGLELEAAWEAGDHWSLFLSYLYNDATVTRAPDNPQVVGKRVRQAPEHSATARVRHHGRWIDSSLVARYIGERYEDEINTLEVDDTLLLDLRFSRSLGERSEIFLSIENLLDETWEVRTTNSGSTEIGRPRFIGLGYRYRR